MTMQDRGLYGFEIRNAVGGGVDILAADQACFNRGPILAVCNTSDSDTAGSHWIVFCIDKYQHGEFFDSFGLPPAAYGLECSMMNCKRWTYNDVRLQDIYSSVCGYYAIAYCRAKLSGVTMGQFISLFSSDTIANDNGIYRWVNAH